MTNEEVLIKQNKWLTCSAINALGPFVKINDNYEPNEGSYAIAAGHLRDLIRDVSAELTDEQKNCEYCHTPFEFIGDYDSGFRIGPHDKTFAYYDASGIGFGYANINPNEQFMFCPMCGRKLGE